MMKQTKMIKPMRPAQMWEHKSFSLLMAALVMVISLTTTYQLWKSEQQRRVQELRKDFNTLTLNIENRFRQRLEIYQQALAGAQGLFAASRDVERDEFRTYTQKLHLDENYPGIQGIGFTLLVPAAQRNNHIDAIRKEGFPDYTIKPEGERETYAPTIYLEPFSGRNLRPFGYDMYSEPANRTALEYARDSDMTTITSKVKLIQEDDDAQAQAGFLMFMPVYANNTPHATLAERRANILGWVEAPFRMGDLMDGILGEHAADIDIEIYDGEEMTDQTLMYDAYASQSSSKLDDAGLQSIQHIMIAGHNWTVALSALPVFEARLGRDKQQLIAGMGTGLSILLALLTWILVHGRSHALQATRMLQSSMKELQSFKFALDQHAIVSIADVNGNITYVNDKFCQTSKYPRDALIGKNHRILKSGMHDAGFYSNMWTTISNGQVWNGEVCNRSKDGEPNWVRLTIVPFMDDHGLPYQYIAIRTDITKIKQIETLLSNSKVELEQRVRERTSELEHSKQTLESDVREMQRLNAQLEEAQNHMMQSEKMASIGQLAAGVAHEINNPIGYVYSNLGTLEKYVQDTFGMLAQYEQAEAAIADPEVRTTLKTARDKLDIAFLKEDLSALMNESKDGITRVKKIVQNLKDFSHVDASDEWHYTDLHSGLNSTLNIVNNEIKYKADVIREYGKIPEVECLSSQLNQVFMNLLVNAAHAIEEHGTITIRTGQQGDEVWVDVADTGKGIAPEHLSKIFDPFFTTKPIGKGTGLGLSLSYGIIQKHHGRIEVQSEVGKGTLFRVWLPVSQPQQTNAQSI